MLLEGSCHCQAVKFSVESAHPYPFNLCYCSICRKTAGAGGFAINLGAENASLQVQGSEHITVYKAWVDDAKTGERKQSPGERHFCKHCASSLWAWDARWPELLHPFASAVDTPLPVAPERTHLMLDSKAPWVEISAGEKDKQFPGYPEESIAGWHERLKLVS